MRDIALFVEDYAHRQFVGALVERFARERGAAVRLDWRNARGGHGKAAAGFRRYLHDLERQGGHPPDLIVVATDANCGGPTARAQEFSAAAPAPIVRAIPDPHIERWFLLDGAAFKRVFGRGCEAPDSKCERGRYKRLLTEAIHAAGVVPSLGGMEFRQGHRARNRHRPRARRPVVRALRRRARRGFPGMAPAMTALGAREPRPHRAQRASVAISPGSPAPGRRSEDVGLDPERRRARQSGSPVSGHSCRPLSAERPYIAVSHARSRYIWPACRLPGRRGNLPRGGALRLPHAQPGLYPRPVKGWNMDIQPTPAILKLSIWRHVAPKRALALQDGEDSETRPIAPDSKLHEEVVRVDFA